MKQYIISFSFFFDLAHGTPWVVQCEGEPGCWNFAHEAEARAFVAKQGDGVLSAEYRGEEEIYNKFINDKKERQR